MRASSAGMEVSIKISQEELSRLENGSLLGEMVFRGIGEHSHMKRKIPIEINHSKEQREFLVYNGIPKTGYFGNAEDVSTAFFSINGHFYDMIKRHGIYGDRFLVSGKLTISLEGRRVPY
jgi:hypothetical protein